MTSERFPKPTAVSRSLPSFSYLLASPRARRCTSVFVNQDSNTALHNVPMFASSICGLAPMCATLDTIHGASRPKEGFPPHPVKKAAEGAMRRIFNPYSHMEVKGPVDVG